MPSLPLSVEDVVLRGTAWLGLLAWMTGEARRTEDDAGSTRGRWAWTLGVLAMLAHTAAAFHLRHDWSHVIAHAETARQTRAVTGLDWGGGLYVNYAFLLVWTADVLWWWLSPAAFGRRPRAIDIVVRGFLLFMFVNGAIVFVPGPMRVLGGLAVSVVLVAWYRRRRRTHE
jgi:hypothetical protein